MNPFDGQDDAVFQPYRTRTLKADVSIGNVILRTYLPVVPCRLYGRPPSSVSVFVGLTNSSFIGLMGREEFSTEDESEC